MGSISLTYVADEWRAVVDTEMNLKEMCKDMD
jgi:hypothetical protein